jgi:hypothetical protein
VEANVGHVDSCSCRLTLAMLTVSLSKLMLAMLTVPRSKLMLAILTVHRGG